MRQARRRPLVDQQVSYPVVKRIVSLFRAVTRSNAPPALRTANMLLYRFHAVSKIVPP